jgi:hypothetical protein
MDESVFEVEISGHTAKVKKSDVAWLAIAGFVAAYDIYAIKTKNETLSSGFWRALRNPRSRWPAVIVCTGLYKHLMFPNFMKELDPLYYLVERWQR